MFKGEDPNTFARIDEIVRTPEDLSVKRDAGDICFRVMCLLNTDDHGYDRRTLLGINNITKVERMVLRHYIRTLPTRFLGKFFSLGTPPKAMRLRGVAEVEATTAGTGTVLVIVVVVVVENAVYRWHYWLPLQKIAAAQHMTGPETPASERKVHWLQ